MYQRNVSREFARTRGKHPYFRAMWAFDWWREALGMAIVLLMVAFCLGLVGLVSWSLQPLGYAFWTLVAGVAWWIACVLRADYWCARWQSAPSPYVNPVGGYDG